MAGRTIAAAAAAIVAVVAAAGAGPGTLRPPYPPSPVIRKITWHWDT